MPSNESVHFCHVLSTIAQSWLMYAAGTIRHINIIYNMQRISYFAIRNQGV
jgi:hypothetical protein